MATPNEPEWKIVEEPLQEEMAIGRSPSTIKTVLSAATWAVSMGIAEHIVPRFLWKYVKGVENAWDDKKVGKYSGDQLRPCRHWLPRPKTQPTRRWWQQRYRR